MGKSGLKNKNLQIDQSCAGASRLPDKAVGRPIAPCQLSRDRCKPCARKPHADPNIPLLCDVFCRVLCIGERAKKNRPNERFNYSKTARKLGEKQIKRGALPPGFKPEKRYLVNFDKANDKKLIQKLKDAGRRDWTPQMIRNRLIKQVGQEHSIKNLRRLLRKKAASAWKKLIPGLNVASTISDIVDIANLAIEIKTDLEKAFSKFDPSKYDTFEAIPDMAMEDNGRVTKVYDYKFPGDSFSEDQRALYKRLSGGAQVTSIDDATCDCGCKQTPTS